MSKSRDAKRDREESSKNEEELASKKLKTEAKIGSMTNANFPTDAEGRVYHLGVKRGEVHNRVLSVGDPKRAEILANLFDSPDSCECIRSKRGFVIYNGTVNQVPVSIIVTGMGFPMMDFVVRETRAVVDGPMVFIRLGTCGAVKEDVKLGSVAVCSLGSIGIRRNSDAWTDGQVGEPNGKPKRRGSKGAKKAETAPFYQLSKPVASDKVATDLLIAQLNKTLTKNEVVVGLNATADSFYSSQGRIDDRFDDKNSSLIDDAVKAYPDLITLEMETFHLLDLARVSSKTHPIAATAATIVLAQRRSNEFLDNDSIHRLEKEAGQAALNALSSYPLPTQ